MVDAIPKEVINERYYVDSLYNEVLSIPYQKVIVLFGIRDTGKTVGMWQCVKRLLKDPANIDKIAFVDCLETKKRETVEETIEDLCQKDIKYIFIDEISGVEGTINALAGYANHVAGRAALVMAGTDSFVFAEAFGDRLYHRHVTFPLAFMSFQEYHSLLNRGIESALKESGTFRRDSTIAGRLGDTVQSAILNNIVRSVIKNKDYFLRDKAYCATCKAVAKLFNKLQDDELMYLTTAVLLDAVKPKTDGIVDNVGDLSKDMDTLATFIRMTGDRYRAKDAYTDLLRKVTRKYGKEDVRTLRDCLARLEIISVLSNRIPFIDPAIDIEKADAEVVCMIPSIFYELNFLYKRGGNDGDLFENYALSQTIGILRGFGSRFEVSFARFRDNSVEGESLTREIDIVIEDLVDKRIILVEIKKSEESGSGRGKHLRATLTDKLFPNAIKIGCYNGEDDEDNGIEYMNITSFVKYLAGGC